MKSFTWAKMDYPSRDLIRLYEEQRHGNGTMNLLYGMTADGATIIQQTIGALHATTALRSTALSLSAICRHPAPQKPKQKLWRGSRPERCSRHHRPHPRKLARRTGNFQSTRSSKEALLRLYGRTPQWSLPLPGTALVRPCHHYRWKK